MVQAQAAPRRRRLRRSVTLLLPLLFATVAILGGCIWQRFQEDLPSQAERSEMVARLEAAVLPLVSELQVAYYMDEFLCKVLAYRRGDFVDGDPEHCGGPTGSPSRFDDIARADHARIKAALSASGTPVERTGGANSGDGPIRGAWFSSTRGAPFATTWSLEYDPAGIRSAGPEGMLTWTAVEGKADWWFACCGD